MEYQTNQMEYLENIKNIRIKKGLSQLEMSNSLGMAQNNYGKIERGLTELTVKKLIEIANVLQTEISEILNFKNINPEPLLEHINYLENVIEERDNLTNLLYGYLLSTTNELNQKIKELNSNEKDKNLWLLPHPIPPKLTLNKVEKLKFN